MQNRESSRGAMHGILILTYIIWLSLFQTPAADALPERGFAQGQPEMQLAMDNMVRHKVIITKRVVSNGRTNQEVLTSKASDLLAEAEQILSNLPNPKEKKWIEFFVQRMRSIATMLDKTDQNKNLPQTFNSVSGTPVPEGLPSPTWPATSTVPGNNPFQKPMQMMSKFPATSPELSNVLQADEYHTERQVDIKPTTLANKEDESDELVRELESLHEEFPQKVNFQTPKVLNQVLASTTPSTASASESVQTIPANVETVKAKLKAKLMDEIAEFQRLGGVLPKEVDNALHRNNQKDTGSVYNHYVNTDNKMEFTETGKTDKQEMMGLGDLKNEDENISKTSFLNIPYQAEPQFHHLKFNHTFKNNYPRQSQAFPKRIEYYFQNISPQNKELYQGHPQNTVQGGHKTNPYFQRKYNTVTTPNHYLGHIPDAFKQMLPNPHNNFYNGYLTASDYNKYLMKHSYEPYPYVQNWGVRNTTLHLSPMASPYLTKQPINHKIDTQLSDEMKRELRDGKIIVLSDSVLHSNFDQNNAKNTESKPETFVPENINSNKNETVTEN